MPTVIFKAVENRSLRGSAHTAVAIPEGFCPYLTGALFYLGDSHTSLRTGSE